MASIALSITLGSYNTNQSVLYKGLVPEVVKQATAEIQGQSAAMKRRFSATPECKSVSNAM